MNCSECGGILLPWYQDKYRGMCKECWIKHIAKLRMRYGKYQDMLARWLAERGILLQPTYVEGLDNTGRPAFPVRDADVDMLPLRYNEYGVYLFEAGGGVLAFPDNGIGLRYIKAPSDKVVIAANEITIRLLAAGSDGKYLYRLSDQGELYSTNEEFEQFTVTAGDFSENNKRKSKQMIDVVPYCQSLAKEYFTDKQINAAVSEFCKGISCCDKRNTVYYDAEAKKFFLVIVDGNYYHGYDVSYPLLSKEEAIRHEIKTWFSLYDFEEECIAGKIPLFLILLHLPYEEGNYSPPDNFGCGIHFA